MKVVIHRGWGGFSVPEEVRNKLNCPEYFFTFEEENIVRCSETFVEWVYANPQSEYRVIEIPADATDWQVNEYDGFESVIAVVNGKINWL